MSMVRPRKVKMKHWVNTMRPYPEHTILDSHWPILDNRIIPGKQDKNIVLYLQSMMDTVAKHP